jgi:hypothetical protein
LLLELDEDELDFFNTFLAASTFFDSSSVIFAGPAGLTGDFLCLEELDWLLETRFVGRDYLTTRQRTYSS